MILFILFTTIACGSFVFRGNPAISPQPAAVNTATPDKVQPSLAAITNTPFSVPTPTILPITETSTPKAVVTQTPPNQGACANPLFPLIPGHQWVYKITSNNETSKMGFTVTELNNQEAAINSVDFNTGMTSTTTIECDNGKILNFPVSLLGFIIRNTTDSVEINRIEGVFLPDYQTFERKQWHNEWEGTYLVTGVINANIDGKQATGKLNQSPLKLEWATLPFDKTTFTSITVPAGKFDNVILIKRNLQLDFTTEVEQIGIKTSVAATVYLTNKLWYALNVGLLKQTIEKASIKIYGVEFPAAVEGSMELLRFSTNN